MKSHLVSKALLCTSLVLAIGQVQAEPLPTRQVSAAALAETLNNNEHYHSNYLLDGKASALGHKVRLDLQERQAQPMTRDLKVANLRQTTRDICQEHRGLMYRGVEVELLLHDYQGAVTHSSVASGQFCSRF